MDIAYVYNIMKLKFKKNQISGSDLEDMVEQP